MTNFRKGNHAEHTDHQIASRARLERPYLFGHVIVSWSLGRPRCWQSRQSPVAWVQCMRSWPGWWHRLHQSVAAAAGADGVVGPGSGQPLPPLALPLAPLVPLAPMAPLLLPLPLPLGGFVIPPPLPPRPPFPSGPSWRRMLRLSLAVRPVRFSRGPEA